MVALGGYGRGRLSPRSDVDVMLLCQAHNRPIEELARAVFYPLWDRGFETGHAVRTPDECRRLAAASLEAQTAFLDARLLAGDAQLYKRWHQAFIGDLRRQGARLFLRSLREESRRRHARSASLTYQLEPDIKDGKGGLRDVQGLLWASRVLGVDDSLAGLTSLGVLSPEEATEIEEAEEFFHQVRDHLHELAGRLCDRVLLAYHDELANRLGYRPMQHLGKAEALLHDLHAQARAVAGAADALWEALDRQMNQPRRLLPLTLFPRKAAGDRGRAQRSGENWRWPEESPLARRPELALRAFANAAWSGRPPDAQTLRAIRQGLASVGAAEAWTPDERDGFLRVLGAGEAAVPLLEAMDRCGLLALYVPEWDRIRCLSQRDGYHQETVDYHCFRTVAELGRPGNGTEYDGGLSVRLFSELDDASPLLLAALLHDVGKGGPEHHCQAGATLAGQVAQRAGLDREAVETVEFLVCHHLLLPRTALHRDIEDDEMVERLADLIGSRRRLAMLYVLAVADARATGPGAWGLWRATLLRHLYVRLQEAMHSAAKDEGEDATDDQRRAAMIEAIAAETDRQHALAFVDSLPSRYRRLVTLEEARAHYAMAHQAADIGGGLALNWQLQPGQRAFERPVPNAGAERAHPQGPLILTLAAPDRPGLLWRICGVLALHSVNVLEARVFTTSDGVAIDTFRLADAFEGDISESKQAQIERDLTLALAGRLSLDYRLAEKRRHYRRQESGALDHSVQVYLDSEAAEGYTLVEVAASDRIGLLYSLARALSELQLNIHFAKVSTRGHQAFDVFYVTDASGHKVADSHFRHEVERALAFAAKVEGT